MSGSTEDWERWYARKEPAVTRNGPLTYGPTVTGCGCDLERRLRVRMAEAEDAADAALGELRQLVPSDAYEVERLARLARVHQQLAEALGAVLEGGF